MKCWSHYKTHKGLCKGQHILRITPSYEKKWGQFPQTCQELNHNSLVQLKHLMWVKQRWANTVFYPHTEWRESHACSLWTNIPPQPPLSWGTHKEELDTILLYWSVGFMSHWANEIVFTVLVQRHTTMWCQQISVVTKNNVNAGVFDESLHFPWGSHLYWYLSQDFKHGG